MQLPHKPALGTLPCSTQAWCCPGAGADCLFPDWTLLMVNISKVGVKQNIASVYQAIKIIHKNAK